MQPKAVIITLVSVGFILAGGMYLVYKNNPAKPIYTDLDSFAKCLAEKEVTMYGAAWCSHCQAQKQRFGESFKYVPYVECPDNPQKCVDANVSSYPTWVFKDGTRLLGEQELARLAELSACPLR